MSRAEALFDCVGESVDEISFRAGDIITDVVKADDAGWMKGRTPNGAIGLFPANYVKIEDRPARPARPVSNNYGDGGGGRNNNNQGMAAVMNNSLQFSAKSASSYSGPADQPDSSIDSKPPKFDKYATRQALMDKSKNLASTASAALPNSSNLAAASSIPSSNAHMKKPPSSFDAPPQPSYSSIPVVAKPPVPVKAAITSSDYSSSYAAPSLPNRPPLLQSNNGLVGPETPNRLSESSTFSNGDNSNPAIPKRPPLLVSNQSVEPPRMPSRVSSSDPPPPPPSRPSISSCKAQTVSASAPPPARPPPPLSKPSSLAAPNVPQKPAQFSSANTVSSSSAENGAFNRFNNLSIKDNINNNSNNREPSDARAAFQSLDANQRNALTSAATSISSTMKPSDYRAIANTASSMTSSSPEEIARNSKPSDIKAAYQSMDANQRSAVASAASNIAATVKPSDLRAAASSFASSSSSSDSAPGLPRRSQVSSFADKAALFDRRSHDPPANSNFMNNTSSFSPQQPPLPSRPSAATFGANKLPFGKSNNAPSRPSQHEDPSSVGNLTKDARQRYEDLFEEQDQDRDGYIDGEDVRTIWLRSGLDAPALGKVWNLADRDCDGYLTRVEFVVGMFLIDDRLRGYPIPEQLPYFLQQLQ